MKESSLTILAGKDAIKRLSQNGLKPEDISTIAGAAGGPKWLALSQIDRALFGNWLQPRTRPLHLIGSSIGAWRFSACTQRDAVKGIENFEQAYFSQKYSAKPSPQEVTQVGFHVMGQFLSDSSIHELLQHPYYRLSILTVRCRNLMKTDRRTVLLAGVGAAAITNLIHPSLLKLYFEREVFSDHRELPAFLSSRNFKSQIAELTPTNFRRVLMASGSIPGVMAKIDDLHTSKKLVHRDGGILDYHLDLPYTPVPNNSDTILFPHYTDKIVPNWFDKYLPWRKSNPENLRNVILVCPSRKFISTLPLGKIPDRNDFGLFKNRDEDRLRYWKQVVADCERLKDDFSEIFNGNRIAEFARPLPS